jgi:acetate kinase
MYNYRIKKYIGAFSAAMGGLDILVFTGGIGENSDSIRAESIKDLEFMGIQPDLEKNKGARGIEQIISMDSSTVKVIVVPTNEELVIAEDTKRIVENMRNQNAAKLMDY